MCIRDRDLGPRLHPNTQDQGPLHQAHHALDGPQPPTHHSTLYIHIIHTSAEHPFIGLAHMTCQPCAATSGQLTQPPTRLMHQDITSPDRELGYRVWRRCAERMLRSALLRIMLICLCGRVCPQVVLSRTSGVVVQCGPPSRCPSTNPRSNHLRYRHRGPRAALLWCAYAGDVM